MVALPSACWCPPSVRMVVPLNGGSGGVSWYPVLGSGPPRRIAPAPLLSCVAVFVAGWGKCGGAGVLSAIAQCCACGVCVMDSGGARGLVLLFSSPRLVFAITALLV